jgi:NAD-dependent dihydropyrimidine dehydrogenase PreA subunit
MDAMILDSTEFTYVGNGNSLRIDVERCTGCGACLDVCPHAVMELRGRKAVVVARDRCMECGACRLNCSFHAVNVQQGVGCVAALINGMLGKKGSECCSTGSKSSGRCGC